MPTLALATPVIGANVNRVDFGTTVDGVNATQRLGTRITGDDGTMYVYVQAAAAITTTAAPFSPNAVAISPAYQAALMTTALANDGQELGFAPIAANTADGVNVDVIPDNAFFWARVMGSNFPVRVAISAAANTYLRTTINAGRLGTASTASAVVFTGVVINAAASASTSALNTVRTVNMTMGRAVRSGASTFVN